MAYSELVRTPYRVPRILVPTIRGVRRGLVAGLRVIIAAMAKALGYRLIRIEYQGELGLADGAVPYRTTVFADEIPAVANLDPDLLDALRQAAREAARDGITFYVNSGWRSPEYQNKLRREAVAKYGSEEEAARWVATPDTSPHVLGNAVDIGPIPAAAWLSKHGAKYGLCQIYRNEPWHYELRTEAIEHGCPPMDAYPSQDPRMRTVYLVDEIG